MKIKLNRLTLLNFKGIRSLDIKFQQITNISGENATGKTTILDAFLWLLFGKDSTGRSDSNFEIKTLDANNQPFHRMDHEVAAEMIVDDQEIVLKRVYKENWVKKRGESETVFSGHTTSFYWNDVPLKLEEYQAKISGILPEGIFKLIANNGYFNTLKWEDRRNVLMNIAGVITNDDVIDSLGSKINSGNNHQFSLLLANLNAKKSLDEFKREISSKKKKIKEELDLIPARIDEANRNLPDAKDYTQILFDIDMHRGTLEKVEDQLMDKTNAQRERQNVITAKLNEIQGFRTQRQQIEFDERNAARDRRAGRENDILEAKRQLRIKNDDVLRNNSELTRLKGSKTTLEKDQAGLRTKFADVNAKKLEFKEGEFSCPACKREFASTDIETKKAEFTKNFNADKSKSLSEIQDKGKALGVEIAKLDSRIKELEETDQTLNTEIDALNLNISALEEEHTNLSRSESLQIERAIANSPKYLSLGKQISAMEEEVNAPQAGDDKASLLQQKRGLVEKIDSLKLELNSKEQRQKTLNRIDQLSVQEKEMSGSLADLEGVEFAILQFTKAKMDLLESRINGRFKLVKFKLFQEQINGGEVPCCETLIKGVPYQDANTASRINAGLDIINTLCAHYNAFAPVFVDNAESVNTLIPVDAQLIRLVVSKDKKLKIESPKGELFEQEA